MIFNNNILNKFLINRNLNILLHGLNTDIFNSIPFKSKKNGNFEYKTTNSIYLLDIILTKNDELFNLITEFTSITYFYNEIFQRNVIILLNIQNLKSLFISKLIRILETSKECCFILHINNLNILDRCIKSHFLIFSLPLKKIKDNTISITYNNIIKIIKEPLTKKNIEIIREICYMYYMNHSNSVELQKYIIKHIGKISILPNEIKYTIVKDIVNINNMYNYSYRKPLYLECIIYSLFKHLEHYTI